MFGGLYWNRKLVYTCLVVFGALTLNDAVPQYTLLHGKLKDIADPVLDVTGLWQGSWALFAPTPDHVNVRIWARITWKDRTESIWHQPDWNSMSAWKKTRHFRQMSWYDGLWRSSNRPALEPFCRHLATHQAQESFREVVMVQLYQDRDVIPPPSQKWRPAYSAPQYSVTSQLFTWTAHD